MPSLFGPVINVTESPNAWDFSNDIIQHALDGVATNLQERLRSRLDSGVSYTSAMRARSITVRNEEGQLIVKEKAPDQGTQINDLFKTSTAPPTIDGGQMVFRQMQEKEINRRNEQTVKHSFEEIMRLRFSEHIEEGIRRVRSENPSLLIK